MSLSGAIAAESQASVYASRGLLYLGDMERDE
jgi:hypothetical protein